MLFSSSLENSNDVEAESISYRTLRCIDIASIVWGSHSRAQQGGKRGEAIEIHTGALEDTENLVSCFTKTG